MGTSSANIGTHSDEESGRWSRPATPWSRYWARLLDVQINDFILSLLLGRLFPVFVSNPVFTGPGGGYILAILLLPLTLMLDAACQAAFGTTIGKAVAGIRVETIDHRRLSINLALRRNLSVYLRGLILGMPLLALAGYLQGYNCLKKGGQTSWDAALYTRVHNIAGNAVRTTIAAILMVSIQVGAVAYTTYAKSTLGNHVLTDEELAASAPAMNASLPRQIDDDTRLDSAQYSRPYRMMTFTYTLIRRDGNRVPADAITQFFQNSEMDVRLRKLYCTDPSLQSYRDNGIAVKYLYLANDQSTVGEHIFHVTDCR